MFEIQREKSIYSVGLFTSSCLSLCKLGSLHRRTIQGFNLLVYQSYYQSVSIQFKSDKIPLHLCTHIFYTFAAVNLTTFETRWGISNLPWSITVYFSLSDVNSDIDLGSIEGINELKEKQPELKTILSFGGYITSQHGTFSVSSIFLNLKEPFHS